jgi:hypothetical protein
MRGAKLNLKTAIDILTDPDRVQLYDPDCKKQTRIATIEENFCMSQRHELHTHARV